MRNIRIIIRIAVLQQLQQLYTLICLDRGVIKGDDQGRSNWNKPVSRAEAVVIFNNVSQIH